MEKHPFNYQAVSKKIESLIANLRFEEALRLYRETIGHIVGADGRVEALAAHVGGLCFNAGKFDEAIELLSDAVGLLGEEVSDGDDLQMHIILANALCTRNRDPDLLRAANVLQSGFNRMRGGNERVDKKIGLHGHFGNVMSMLGAHASGELHHCAAIALAQKAKDRRAEELWTGNLGMNRLGADDATHAIEHFVAALRMADEINSGADRPRWEAGLQGARNPR